MTGEPDSRPQQLRIKQVLDRLWLPLVLGLLAVGALGGGLALTAYVAPGTVSEERVVSSWERTTRLDHGATVTEPNPAFPVGTELEDRDTYLTAIAPEANVSAVVGFDATRSGQVNATVRLLIQRQATAGEGTVLWTTRQPLRSTSRQLSPGDSLRVPVTLSMPAVQSRTENLSRQFGTTGQVSTSLVAVVEFSGEVNGETVEQSFRRRATLEITGDQYGISTGGTERQQFRTTETVRQPRQYGPFRRIGGPLLAAVGVLGAAVVGLLGRRGRFELSPAERRWAAYLRDRAEYSDWIHGAELPPEATDLPQASATSLPDLVDIAIDIGGTVIESPDGGRYYVVDDDICYVFEAPPRPEATGADSPETGTDDAPTSAPDHESTDSGADDDESDAAP